MWNETHLSEKDVLSQIDIKIKKKQNDFQIDSLIIDTMSIS